MKKVFITLFAALLTLSSCDEGFEKLNTDPNNPTSVDPNLLVANSAIITANVSYSTFNGADQGTCWVQQWSKVQYNDEERYSPRPGTSGNIWALYSGIQELIKAEEDALASGNKVLSGVALTLKAYNYQILTDLFGDVPFSEANKGSSAGIFTPKYDSQEEIYAGILEMYTEGMALIASGEGSVLAANDRIFAGDVSKWLKFATSLKFRALMRVSNASSVTNPALQNIGSQLQGLVGGLMTSNDDSAYYHYFEASPNANPHFETIQEGNRIEFRVSETIVNYMNSTNDARLAIYAQPAPDGTSGIRGAGPGVSGVPNNDYNYNNTSLIGSKFLEAQAPAYFLRYSELEFLKAEAAHRGLISGNSSDYFASAVQASFAENGAGDATTFIAGLAFSPANALELIGYQKWVALFGQGFEAFSEYRRTGFPNLSPAVNPIGISTVPSRYNYPVEEQSVNAANYQAAVAAQGADVLTTKVWWNK